jgi:hypothetical protein
MTSLPDGMFLDQYGNAKRKVDDLSGAELRYFEQYRRQQVARNNQRDAQARGAAAQAAAAAANPANVAPADMTPAEEIVALKPKVSNQPDYGFKFPETDNPFTAYPAVMVSWRNPVTGETASYTAGMEPPAGSPWEEGSYTPEEQNQIKKDINLTPAEIEETIVPPVAAPFQPIVPPVAPFQPIVPPVAAPTPPTIPNLPSLELPQMVPPVQEGIASLAPQPMVPAFQPFIPAPAPTNTGYNFQELLNMYKNPYA